MERYSRQNCKGENELKILWNKRFNLEMRQIGQDEAIMWENVNASSSKMSTTHLLCAGIVVDAGKSLDSRIHGLYNSKGIHSIPKEKQGRI